MNTKNLYIDVHILQTVPPANLNRDDTGSPKTAVYGGATRARVSSQSWKRAMRRYFKENGRTIASRTKKVPTLLANKLKEINANLDNKLAMEKAKAILKVASISKFDEKNDTKVLLAVSPGQVEKLAYYASKHEDLDKKEVKKLLQDENTLDLALFGRMVADDPELNVEAASQVAHAISTNEIVPEFDYYTAIDDLKNNDNAGASMLGDIEYNSSTLYRYANINVKELIADLGKENALGGVADFIQSFALSMPTGKQNTFANKTLPNYIMVVIREDTPVNLVSAFEIPVRSQNGYVAKSIKRLEEEYQNTNQFVEEPVLQIILEKGTVEGTNHVANLKGLINKVTEALTEVVRADENTNS